MNKTVLAMLSLSMLVTACATESKLAASSEAVEPMAVDSSQTLQPATTQHVDADAKLVEIKAVAKPANDQTVSRLAAAPDFYHCLVSWSGAVQTTLTPWTGAIKQCDTLGSAK